MKSSLVLPTLTAVALLTIASPALAHVQIQLNTSVDAGVATTITGTTSAKAKVSLDTRMSNTKDRADKEIDRRTQMLIDLSAKVGDMAHVSSAEKAAIADTVTMQISALNDLKTKIAADTDTSVLKTDVHTISDSYRIFILVIPRAHIDVAADKIDTTIADMGVFAGKLQARISAASGDTSALSAQLTQMNAKVADAKIQADAAVSSIATLQPDNGDKSVQTSNQIALKNARAKIKVAMDDLKAARKTAGDIVKALGGSKAEVHASASSTVEAPEQD